MKKIITIIIVCLIGVGLTWGAVALIVSSEEEVIEIKTYEYDNINEIKKIDIDTSSSSIIVKKNSENKIKVELEESDKAKYTINVDGDTLKVQQQFQLFILNISFREKKVIVYLPENYICNLSLDASSGRIVSDEVFTVNELDVEVSSGSINLSNMTILENASIEDSSGSITLENMSFNKEINTECSSGSILLTKCNSKESYDISGTSGRITLSNCETLKGIEAENSSGRIIIKDCKFQTLDLDCSSGSIEIEASDINITRINAKSGSGSVKVVLPAEIKGFIANTNIGSGSYYSNFGTNNPNYFGDGSIILNLKTSSGSIYVNKK